MQFNAKVPSRRISNGRHKALTMNQPHFRIVLWPTAMQMTNQISLQNHSDRDTPNCPDNLVSETTESLSLCGFVCVCVLLRHVSRPDRTRAVHELTMSLTCVNSPAASSRVLVIQNNVVINQENGCVMLRLPCLSV